MQIVAENLTYNYGGKGLLSVKALNGASLTVKEGAFFGVLGHTGSGKSTFVQHLNGLIKVGKNCGKLTVGEYDLSDKKCDFKGLRAKIGMVFQYPEYQLFAETVKEDVAFAIKNFFPQKGESEIEQTVKEAISLVGLDYEKIKDKSPFELSGGQKRRVAIAGVIVARPEILVLDEPAVGLDPLGKKEFLALLKNLHNSFVKTIIIVSHDMNIISENCTEAAIFSHGKVVAQGSPKEIFSDAELIKDCGLELPVTAFVTRALADKGITLDSDLTKEDFIRAAIEKFGGER